MGDKADVLNLCLKPTWTICWFPFLPFLFKTCKNEAGFSSTGSRGQILAPEFDTVSFPNNFGLLCLEARSIPLLKL